MGLARHGKVAIGGRGRWPVVFLAVVVVVPVLVVKVKAEVRATVFSVCYIISIPPASQIPWRLSHLEALNKTTFSQRHDGRCATRSLAHINLIPNREVNDAGRTAFRQNSTHIVPCWDEHRSSHNSRLSLEAHVMLRFAANRDPEDTGWHVKAWLWIRNAIPRTNFCMA
ncbi:hypothetical protein Cob_v010539 [Colletotrichum orbiculare MAFF 240422]|uniref:Uncharacterized protein n=1 Tax=Colletotrichum orbiculare (strain 104-T / ATCC 96160 / CBS 514.97 / LARS 414 / MAFF 240422) TaxID=1213857 RepID=A0A484FDQ9_COLOR|nr:hypothetical protein Cob_v010539 [Colletotrichum orbiculare MAFF 240422]